jgi:hypothetical protein
MSREILFRGKDENTEKWLEGSLTISQGDEDIYWIFTAISEVKDARRFSAECSARPVLKDTVCEYTGLTDDNGKKIFENDILKLHDKNTDYTWYAKVVFGNPHGEYTWGWNLIPLTTFDGNTDILLWIDMPRTTCEIVGNAIDHEEMFKCCCVAEKKEV